MKSFFQTLSIVSDFFQTCQNLYSLFANTARILGIKLYLLKFKTIILIKKTKNSKTHQSGQLIIEYVLLLTVVTVLAATLIRVMVGQSDDPTSQGLIVRKWTQVISAIAGDVIDN